MPLKSIVFPSNLAGVPVWSLPNLKPAEAREADKPREGASLSRPAGKRFMPEKFMTVLPSLFVREPGWGENAYRYGFHQKERFLYR
jgi:hypothetical protein